jgi:1-acyl-sn-glycerol-3-phosphate acyltransferase
MCDSNNGSQDPLDLVSLKWFQSKITVQLEIVPVLVTIFAKKYLGKLPIWSWDLRFLNMYVCN